MTQARPATEPAQPTDTTRALAAAAGLGVCAALTQYVVARHYLQIEWAITIPVPLAWWAVAGAAGVVGAPLFLVVLGRRAERLVVLPWGRLLLTWVVPVLVAHYAWLACTVALLRRIDPGLVGTPMRDSRELLSVALLPPPELSLLWALALFPLIAKAAQRVPGAALVAVLCAATLLTSAVSFLVFLAAGLRFAPQIERAVRPSSWRDLVARAVVAVVGACVLGVDRFPADLAVVVAGLAALPFALAVAARLRFRALMAVGAAAVPMYSLLVPVLGLADKALLARLSAMGSTVQLAVALAEPLALVAGIALGGLVLMAVVRQVRGRALAGMAR
ncbi:hypothetical protein ACPCHT_13375 [Nucisporomicrobium flavum]|uniref:hypothetical protein n=1 Tax=Nucisporomicrobium flavum TaxID=2785915 RepID=UPI003C2DC8B8